MTFHGGDNSITYPWGAFAHQTDQYSGDDIAYREVADLLKSFAGDNSKLGINEYDVGTMQDVVYDVNGGFEDWAYGASWDKKNVPQLCRKNEFLKDQIGYADESNRSFVYLVEAGESKTPDSSTLGNEMAVFDPFSEKSIWGNLSRNIYMSLKFGEYVNPTILIDEVKFNKGILIKLRFLGCVKITDIKIDGINFLILSKKLVPDTGHHLVNLIVTQIEDYMPEIVIQTGCDYHWRNETMNKQPETHLVKLRTDEDY